MSRFIAWLKSKNVNAHTVAAVLVTVAGAIVLDSEVRNFVLELFAVHPKIGTAIITAAGIYFRYSHSSKPAVEDPKQLN